MELGNVLFRLRSQIGSFEEGDAAVGQHAFQSISFLNEGAACSCYFEPVLNAPFNLQHTVVVNLDLQFSDGLLHGNNFGLYIL